MPYRFRKTVKLACMMTALVAVIGTAGCARSIPDLWKEEAANRIAVPANLHKRQVSADPFSITVFERVYAEGQQATIYIEGDGKSWMGGAKAPENPTPDYPVALHLASRDLGDNVIYVSRPCQFSGMVAAKTPCAPEYWAERRFSLEAMQSMNTVLDKLKSRYDLRGFHLVGYSGGAAVATMLAAKRDDVLSLRTVAGNLDHVLLNTYHNLPQMPGSLNPRDFARDVAHIPQHHFLGAWDETVPPGVYESFRSAMGRSSCARMSMVDEVNHEDGWANRWQSLLAMPVDCSVSPAE